MQQYLVKIGSQVNGIDHFHLRIQLFLNCILYFLLQSCSAIFNHCILVMIDNTGVVAIFNTTTSKNRGIMRLVRQLVLACLKCNILFRCKHGTRLPNVIAHRLSRFQFVEAKQSAPWLDVKPVIIPTHLTSHVIIPQIVSWVKRHSHLTRELHIAAASKC